MKKYLLTVAAMSMALATMSCSGNAEGSDNTNDSTATEQAGEQTEAQAGEQTSGIVWDYEFPKEYDLGDVQKDQYVLAVDGWKKWEEKGDKASSTHISNLSGKKFVEKGAEMSTLEGDQVSPNALIIPFPLGATAKKGDVVLTFWQGGGGDFRRALVTDASNPKQPKVIYLDMDYKEDGKGMANRHADRQLEENSFMVIPDGKLVPGAAVAYKNGSNWEALTFMRDFGGKALCLKPNRSGVVYPTSDLKVISFKESFKPGDAVSRVSVGKYRPGYKVVKVDTNVGRIWVKDDRDRETIEAFGDVTKTLD